MAEDSTDNRMVAKAYLRREPYELEFAENGRRAVELFQANRYALVLMDMQMPELDGFVATAEIRQWERSQALAPTPIVALTASVLEKDVRRALNAGCNLHLGKPIKKPLLLEVIRNLVSAAAPPATA